MKIFGTEFKFNGFDIWHKGNFNPANKSDTGHTHTKSNITDFPTALPASGGNADTVDNKHASDFYQNDSVIMNTNPFGGNRLYINSIDNAMHAASKKWFVTITTHLKAYNSENYPKLNPSWVASYTVTGSGTTYSVAGSPTDIIVYVDDAMYTKVTTPNTSNNYSYSNGTITFGKTITGTVYAFPEYTVPQYLDSPVSNTFNDSQCANIFDGSYESALDVSSDKYMKIRITGSTDCISTLLGYPYGIYFLSYYYTYTPDKAEYRVFNRTYRPHGIGWKKYDFGNYTNDNTASNFIQSLSDNGNYGRTILEFIIYGHPNHNTSLTEIDWKLERPDLGTSGSTVTKYGTNKLYSHLYFGNQTENKVTISPFGSITADNFLGNASTAFKLQTPRTINGVYFDGSSNITITDSTKEPSITAGTATQYFRGDKSWQMLDRAAVGLSNVDNTSDANKNVLSATKLTTSRKINGIDFNGTTDITITANPNAHTHTKSQITDFPTLSTVATSGSYNDLLNKPTIPTIPSSLPANGGNSDTVGGLTANQLQMKALAMSIALGG